MSWYWWLLIYVAIALVIFRFAFIAELDNYQRAMHKWNQERYPRERIRDIKSNHNIGLVMAGLMSGFWPITIVCVLMYFLSRGVFWLMFPRGIRTKFDREQQLEREKKETQIKYQEAKALLEQEGIKI